MVFVGLAGVLLVIRPGVGIVHWAVILPLLAALFYATLQITTRVLGQQYNALTTLFYTSTCGLIFSMYRSCTSGARLVTPQAMRSLCPTITPGTPAKEYPVTS